MRAKSGHDFLSQRTDKTEEESKINNAKRVIGADLFKDMVKIRHLQTSQTPKKLKDAVSGRFTNFISQLCYCDSKLNLTFF